MLFYEVENEEENFFIIIIAVLLIAVGVIAFTACDFNKGEDEPTPCNDSEHTFSHGFCTKCHISNVKYTKSSSGYVPSGVYDSGVDEIVVEKTYKGESVFYVDPSVFSDCEQLQYLTLPFIINSRGGSLGLSSVKHLTLTATDVVYENEFYNTNLVTLTFDCNLTSVGKGSFNNDSLRVVSFLGSTPPELKGSPDNGNVVYLAKTASLDAYKTAFGLWSESFYDYACYSNQAVISDGKLAIYAGDGAEYAIPNGVTEIAPQAFYFNQQLQTVTLPDSLITIGASAFEKCYQLQRVSIGANNGLKTIDDDAFSADIELTELTLPNSLSYMGKGVFSGCTALVLTENGRLLYKDNWIMGMIDPYTVATNLVVAEGTVGICENALELCSVENIELPASFKYIGDSAFERARLKRISLPDGVEIIPNKAFSGCSLLGSVVLPPSVKEIGAEAFYQCYLPTVILPAGLKKIGEKAFNYLVTLTKYTIDYVFLSTEPCELGFACFTENRNFSIRVSPLALDDYSSAPQFSRYAGRLSAYSERNGMVTSDNKLIYYRGGATTLNVPAEITEISPCAFADSNVENLVFSENSEIKSLENISFQGAATVKNVVLPKGLTTLPNFAFNGLTGLKTITIPESVTAFGENLFSGCSSLTDVSFGNNSQLTQITLRMFYDCDSLKTLTIPDSVKTIRQGAFDSCDSLESITVPDSVTRIERGAFSNCNSLKSISLPFVGDGANVYYFAHIFGATSLENGNQYISKAPLSVTIRHGEQIKYMAFAKCYSIQTLTLGEGFTDLFASAFSDCAGLKTVYLPKTMSAINHHAFEGCVNLTDVYVLADNPPDGLLDFDGCPIANIYVPAASVETYKNYNRWSTYEDKIRAISTNAA